MFFVFDICTLDFEEKSTYSFCLDIRISEKFHQFLRMGVLELHPPYKSL